MFCSRGAMGKTGERGAASRPLTREKKIVAARMLPRELCKPRARRPSRREPHSLCSISPDGQHRRASPVHAQRPPALPASNGALRAESGPRSRSQP